MNYKDWFTKLPGIDNETLWNIADEELSKEMGGGKFLETKKVNGRWFFRLNKFFHDKERFDYLGLALKRELLRRKVSG